MIKILEKEPYGLGRNEMRFKLKADKPIDPILDMKPSFWVLLKTKSKIIGPLLLGKRIGTKECYDKYEKNIIANIASVAEIVINNALLFEMTAADTMTNLKLKHYFYTILTEKPENLNNSIDEKSAVSVLMTDIYFF